MQIEKIERLEDSIVKQYNELVDILKEKEAELKEKEAEINHLTDIVQALSAEVAILKDNFVEQVERKVNAVCGSLKLQNSNLKKANEKYRRNIKNIVKDKENIKKNYVNSTRYIIRVLQKNNFDFSTVDGFPELFIKAVLCR